MYDRIIDSALQRRVKNHVVGRGHVFFAVVQPGFENTASRELAGLGLDVSPGFIEGGVEFTGRIADCYRACLYSRTSSRIVMRLGKFRSESFSRLESLVEKFPWELYIVPGSEMAFRAASKKSMIYHTGKLEEIFRKFIDKRLEGYAEAYGRQGIENLSCTLILRNIDDLCHVSIDASGEFLYKRGDRKLVSKAPLRESTAAAILLEAGLSGYERIIDPMCGSGTFSIEAAGILSGAAASEDRSFAFCTWPGYRERAFAHLKKTSAEENMIKRAAEVDFFTSDLDPDAVNLAARNSSEKFGSLVKPVEADFFKLPPSIASGKRTLLVLNPPYGKRIGSSADIYRRIGRKIERDFSGCGFAIIVPGPESEREFGLRYDRKILFMNGGVKAAVLFRDA